MPKRNPETEVKVPLTCGITLGIINTSRRTGHPAGLRRPWDYILSIPEIMAFGNTFRPLFDEVAQDQRSPDAFEGPEITGDSPVSQYRARKSYVPPRGEFYIWRKPTGIEILASIHGTITYTSQARWNEICTRFQQIITNHLGPDARAYLSDYNRDGNNRLYARFDTHIYYREYLPIQQASRELDQLYLRRGD